MSVVRMCKKKNPNMYELVHREPDQATLILERAGGDEQPSPGNSTNNSYTSLSVALPSICISTGVKIMGSNDGINSNPTYQQPASKGGVNVKTRLLIAGISLGCSLRSLRQPTQWTPQPSWVSVNNAMSDASGALDRSTLLRSKAKNRASL